MQVTVEEIKPLTRKLKVTLPQEQVVREMDTAYNKLKGEVAIKGFRKGKAPRHVLEKLYGPRVTQDVVTKLVQDTYFDAVTQAKIDPVVHPDISKETLEPDGGLSYEAEVDIRPVFEVHDYKGVVLETPEVVITDEEIGTALEELRTQTAPLKTVEGRGIQVGDIAVIDYQGHDDGRPNPQVRRENHSVEVGSWKNGKEFEEMLLGLRIGEEAVRDVAFSPNFPNPVLADKNISFNIKVRDVKERVLAPLDDEFAKDYDEQLHTLDELRQRIRDERAKKQSEMAEANLTDQLMANLLEIHQFEVPQRLVDFEVSELVKEFETRLQRQGHALEATGLTREKLAEQYREGAERRVRGDFVLKKISETEDIKLTDKEIETGFQRIADRFGMQVSEVKGYFKSRDDLLPFLNELLNEKILRFLRENATVKVVNPAEQKGAEPTEGAGDTA